MSVRFANTRSACASVSPRDIEQLIAEARIAPLRRARICLHPDTSDTLHEMVIALAGETYVAPHRHPRKSESFHLLAGEIEVIVFSDTGQPLERHRLSAEDPTLPRIMRLQRPVWHSVIVRTEFAVVHETTNGPFRKEDTEFAPWAPNPADGAACAAYQALLREAIGQPAEALG